MGDFGGNKPEYQVMSTDELLASHIDTSIYCGEGISSVAAPLKERLGNSLHIVDFHPPTRRAGVLAQLGFRRLQLGEEDDPITLEPLYLRSAQVDMAKKTWIKT